mmetsp:Transcript_123528/g.357182  ORF Transcript_123528/g.357182 Transcript_123528/m.357182 type:complete len:257 (-) Transcript_123528:933-1703(-)
MVRRGHDDAQERPVGAPGLPAGSEGRRGLHMDGRPRSRKLGVRHVRMLLAGGGLGHLLGRRGLGAGDGRRSRACVATGGLRGQRPRLRLLRRRLRCRLRRSGRSRVLCALPGDAGVHSLDMVAAEQAVLPKEPDVPAAGAHAGRGLGDCGEEPHRRQDIPRPEPARRLPPWRLAARRVQHSRAGAAVVLRPRLGGAPGAQRPVPCGRRAAAPVAALQWQRGTVAIPKRLGPPRLGAEAALPLRGRRPQRRSLPGAP